MSAPGSGGPSPAPIAGDADFAAAGAAEPPPAPPNEPTPGPSSNPPPPPNPNAAGIGGPPRIVPTKVAPDGVREVPRRFEQCEVEDLIQLIASMFNRLIAHNDQIPLTPTSLTRFHSRAPPGISVSDYLLRISRYTNVEPCCLLLLLHYIDRICARLTSFTVSSLTVHRFAIAGVAVGSKALSDSFCTNARYARVGGVTLAEMNLLEREFCIAIDYRLTTTGALLDRYYTQLVGSHTGYRLDPTSEPPTSEQLPAQLSPSSPVAPGLTAVPRQPSPPLPEFPSSPRRPRSAGRSRSQSRHRRRRVGSDPMAVDPSTADTTSPSHEPSGSPSKSGGSSASASACASSVLDSTTLSTSPAQPPSPATLDYDASSTVPAEGSWPAVGGVRELVRPPESSA